MYYQERLQKILNDFARPFGVSFVNIGGNFYCDIVTKEICVSFHNDNDKGFMDSVLRCNPKIECDLFLWSMLHEIFHIVTYPFMTPEDMIESIDMRDLIQKGFLPEKEYYNIPFEKIATEAAVLWANDHIDDLLRLYSILPVNIKMPKYIDNL